MTEDDTFLRLKKVPFEEMNGIRSRAMNDYFSRYEEPIGLFVESDVVPYQQHGWTYVEFIKERVRRLMSEEL